jgi:hypothetical protein
MSHALARKSAGTLTFGQSEFLMWSSFRFWGQIRLSLCRSSQASLHRSFHTDLTGCYKRQTTS